MQHLVGLCCISCLRNSDNYYFTVFTVTQLQVETFMKIKNLTPLYPPGQITTSSRGSAPGSGSQGPDAENQAMLVDVFPPFVWCHENVVL